MTTTILDLKSDFDLPANPTVIEKTVGSMCIKAAVDESCSTRAQNAVTDFAGAMDHGAFPAAREAAFGAIQEANRDRCAMALTITQP